MPFLKGRGAQVRDLIEPALGTFKAFMDNRVQVQRHIRRALQALARMEELVRSTRGAYRLPPRAAAEYKDEGFVFLTRLNAIRDEFGDAVPLFHITIKAHYVMHLLCVSQYIHPDLCSTFKGEDMMRIVKKVISKCHAGTPPRKVVSKAMRRYTQALSLSLQERLFR